ncbi:MAG: hypothetical protein M3373_07065 [Gemmatimonadota bacterium]|nr:hypothetical protein [Gemmatimonadota bacterium]
MFTAYFDDAGTHDDTATEPGSEVVAAAGYVALPSVWQAFEDEWNAFLAREQLPFYHTVDCVARVGHFKGWEHSECNRVHREAVTIITSHKLVAVGYATPKAAFNEVYRRSLPDENNRIARAAYQNSLVSAWRLLALYVNSWWLVSSPILNPIPREQVSIVVEDSPKTYAATIGLYQQAMQLPDEWQHLRSRFAGPPTFRPKLGFPQLQAADVLAYEMAVSLRRLFMPGQLQKRRGSWDALVSHAFEGSRSVGLPLVQFNAFGLSPSWSGGWQAYFLAAGASEVPTSAP